MSRHDIRMTPAGARLQAGIPKGSPLSSPLRANGLTLHGVVTAVYVYDSASSFGAVEPAGLVPNAIYADVLCYGKHEGLLPRVLVTYPRQGMHEGEISLPRATSMAISGDLDPQHTDPSEMDGDHVIVGFQEDDLKRPYIQQYMPHPSADVGNEGRAVGHRMRLKEADRDPRFWKHKGGFWGVDAEGNWVLDMTRAHGGQYGADGTEPEPGIDGSAGNVKLRLPENSRLTIEITKGAQAGDGTDDAGESTILVLEGGKLTLTNAGGAGVVIADKDSSAVLTLGDGAVHAAISEHLEALWTQLTTWLTGTTVLTALGPSAPLPTLAGPPPPWDPTIKSGKVNFPDG